MDFPLIPPNALRSAWSFVREGLDTMPSDDWIAEDVFHAIKSGAAALHLAIDDTGPAGFMVLERRAADYSGLPELHVWLAYNKGERDVLSEGLAVIRETAKRMGTDRITFGSPRPGWRKRFPVVTTTYRIPLGD